MAYSGLPMTTPTLAVTLRSSDPTWNGARSAARTLSAIALALRWSDDALGDDRELVAAEAGHGVAAADDAAQPLAHPDEQGVARVVAVGVVDRLEAVEVEEHHRERHLADDRRGPGAAGPCSSRRLPRPVSGSWSVWWTRSCSADAPLGDVLGLGDRVGGPAVVVLDHPGREERPEGVAVGGDEAQLDAQAPGPAVAQLGQPALEVVGVLGVGEGDEVRGPDHVGVEAEHAAQAGVGLPDAAVELDDGHADRGVGERGLEPGDRLAAGGLGPLAARDVLDVEHEARRLRVVAADQRRVELDPHGVTLGVAEPHVDVEAVDRVVEGAAGELARRRRGRRRG